MAHNYINPVSFLKQLVTLWFMIPILPGNQVTGQGMSLKAEMPFESKLFKSTASAKPFPQG